MIRFELAVTPEIVFGPSLVDALGEQTARFGRRALLVTGGGSLERIGVVARVEALLAERGVSVARVSVAGEPDTETVDRVTQTARAESCDVVVGLGGGSALDAAKSAAALVTNGGEALDYLEVVGRGRALERPSLPFLAVPTTGGTGSETTKNAVLLHRASRTKASLRSPHLLPRLALVDPQLSFSVPPETTAATGLDALTQLIEPFTSRRAQPLVDALAWDAMRRAAHALPRAFEEPDNLAARSDMMLASLVSGIALAHAGLGAAHAFAGPLGGTFPVPHGFACAAVLPHVMEANLRAAPGSHAGDEAVRRYAEVARALNADHGKTGKMAARGGIEFVRELCMRLGVPPLSRYGVTREAVPDLVARAKLTSSMRANPVDLTDEELAGILIAAIG